MTDKNNPSREPQIDQEEVDRRASIAIVNILSQTIEAEQEILDDMRRAYMHPETKRIQQETIDELTRLKRRYHQKSMPRFNAPRVDDGSN